MKKTRHPVQQRVYRALDTQVAFLNTQYAKFGLGRFNSGAPNSKKKNHVLNVMEASEPAVNCQRTGRDETVLPGMTMDVDQPVFSAAGLLAAKMTGLPVS